MSVAEGWLDNTESTSVWGKKSVILLVNLGSWRDLREEHSFSRPIGDGAIGQTRGIDSEDFFC